MKLSDDSWMSADWNDFDNGQKKKTVLWCEEWLSPYFGEECKWCNQFERPPVKKGVKFSTLDDFTEDSIRFYANRMMQTIVWVLSCRNPIKFKALHVNKIPMRQPCYIGIDCKVYHSRGDADRADRSFKERFGALISGIGLETLEKARDSRNVSCEYQVVPRNEIYCSEEEAANRARDLTQVYFRGDFGGMDIRKFCDFDSFDWTRENVVEVPKSVRTADLVYDFKDTSYFDRLRNPEQDDEFLEFLASL